MKLAAITSLNARLRHQDFSRHPAAAPSPSRTCGNCPSVLWANLKGKKSAFLRGDSRSNRCTSVLRNLWLSLRF